MSGKNPVNQESQESQEFLSTVSGTWSAKLIQDQYLNGHERQSACFPLRTA